MTERYHLHLKYARSGIHLARPSLLNLGLSKAMDEARAIATNSDEPVSVRVVENASGKIMITINRDEAGKVTEMRGAV